MLPTIHKFSQETGNISYTLNWQEVSIILKQVGHDGPGSLTWAKIGRESDGFNGMINADWSFFSILISGSHFVEGRRAILAMWVEGHPRNSSVKLFWNQTIDPWGDFS